MSDDALIRRENLRALNISATDLVKSVGSSYQYWRDLMAGNKSFGEKAARRIEEGVGLPRGSLDVPGIKPLEKLPEVPPPVAEPIEPAPPPSGAAPNYLSLDRLFQLLPNDPLVRAVVFQRASAVILDVINGRTGTTPAPVNTETHQKSDA